MELLDLVKVLRLFLHLIFGTSFHMFLSLEAIRQPHKILEIKH